MEILSTVEREWPGGQEVGGAIIWLHGLGADGNDFVPIIPQLDLAVGFGVRFVFPHAPSIPVTINNGFLMPAWYDIKQLDTERHLDDAQLRRSAGWVHALIDREIERGVASERIVIAGFSQGGAVAFESALSYPHTLAGIIALSTYFPTGGSIRIAPAQNTIPILVCHGTLDPVVPEALGRKALARLQNLGFVPEYNSYPMEHAVCPEEIAAISRWLSGVFAPGT